MQTLTNPVCDHPLTPEDLKADVALTGYEVEIPGRGAVALAPIFRELGALAPVLGDEVEVTALDEPRRGRVVRIVTGYGHHYDEHRILPDGARKYVVHDLMGGRWVSRRARV